MLYVFYFSSSCERRLRLSFLFTFGTAYIGFMGFDLLLKTTYAYMQTRTYIAHSRNDIISALLNHLDFRNIFAT